MTRLEYMQYGITQGLYTERWWILSTFGILLPDTQIYHPETKALSLSVDEHSASVAVEGKMVSLTDFTLDTPLFHFDEKIIMGPQSLSSIKAPLETTYGILIVNLIVFYHAFGSKVPYQNKELSKGSINAIAYDLLQSKQSTQVEHDEFENSTLMLTVLSGICVPSATIKSISTNPLMAPLKKRLLADPKLDLTDPAAVAGLQDKLIALDRAYLKGDIAEGFYTKEKSFNVTRLRMHGMYGAEPDFMDESKINVMVPSLAEGWGIDNLPMLNNNIQMGSIHRGSSTALGGVQVKITGRVFQNYTVTEEDCKTQHHLAFQVAPLHVERLVGRYQVGSDTPLTQSMLSALVGRTIKLRDPSTCIIPDTSYCRVCMGDGIVEGVGLNTLANSTTSALLDLFMALTHTTALSVERYDYRYRIS